MVRRSCYPSLLPVVIATRMLTISLYLVAAIKWCRKKCCELYMVFTLLWLNLSQFSWTIIFTYTLSSLNEYKDVVNHLIVISCWCGNATLNYLSCIPALFSRRLRSASKTRFFLLEDTGLCNRRSSCPLAVLKTNFDLSTKPGNCTVVPACLIPIS